MRSRMHQTSLLSAVSLVSLVASGSAVAGQPLTISVDEAHLAADNYVQMIVEKDGAWGEYPAATVVATEPFQRGGRQLGYFCRVEPVGYLVLGMYRDLAPVRLYSCRATLDPQDEAGLAGFIKDRLEALHDLLAEQLGRAIEDDDDLSGLLVRGFRGSWAALTDPAFDAASYRPLRKGRSAGMDYQEGETLLRTTWSQEPPYNDHCPDRDCSWPDHGYFNNNTVTGTAQVAGGQILKYYNWPPQGDGHPYNTGYYWWDVGESYRWSAVNQRMEVRVKGLWRAATMDDIYAVAQICWHVGIALDVGWWYGCLASSGTASDLEEAFEGPFRMDSECDVWYGVNHSYAQRWEMFVRELNANRPVIYHAYNGYSSHWNMVVDGWRVENIGGSDLDQIHLVCSANGSMDGWYGLTEVPESQNHDYDYFVREIYPKNSIHSELCLSYPVPGHGDLPCRYFNRDASGSRTTFAAGQWLQVLRSGFILTNIGTLDLDVIVFNGAPSAELLIFLDGDPLLAQRIRVIDGSVKVRPGGQILIH